MAIGPVQLIVLGFDKPELNGEIMAELDRLRDQDIVRVIDGVGIHKDAEGNVRVIKRSDLSDEDAAEFGAVVGALIGLGVAGEEGAEAGAMAGAAAGEDGIDMFSEENAWDVVEDIPNDSAAAVILLEHRWAIPIRDTLYRVGGFPVADAFIHPLDLVAIGLMAAEDAERLTAAAERSTTS